MCIIYKGSSEEKSIKFVNRKDLIIEDVLIDLCEKFLDLMDLLIVRNLLMILFSFLGFLWFDKLSFLCFNDRLVNED